MGKHTSSDAFEVSGDDSYKTVVDIEHGGEYHKEVASIELRQPLSAQDSFKIVPEPPEEKQLYTTSTVPQWQFGLRKRTFWLLVAGLGVLLVVIIIVASVAGVHASRKHNTSNNSSSKNDTEVSSNPYSGKAFLPGSSLAIASEDEKVRLFFQDGDGNVQTQACTMMSSGSTCKDEVQLNITDAKLFSPIAGAGTMDTIHLFYLNSKSRIRSKIMDSSGSLATDDGLEALDIAVYSDSQLAAIYYKDVLNGGTSTYRLYYQDSDAQIKEYIYAAEDGAAWKAGDTLSEGSPGSKIIAMTWKQWTAAGNITIANSPARVQQAAVYFTASNGSLIEWDWDGLWSAATTPRRPLTNETALAGAIWEDAPTGYPIYRIYSSDSHNSLQAYGAVYNASLQMSAQSQSMQATVANNSYPVAATFFLEKNSTVSTNVSIHVFYQEMVSEGTYRISEKVGNSSMANVDTVTWGDGKGIEF